MIVVKVELWSAVSGQVTELARMTIDNIGGDHNMGDYRVRTLRGRSSEDLDRALLNSTVTREGKVLAHRRPAEHVWNPVAKGLVNLGYGKVR